VPSEHYTKTFYEERRAGAAKSAAAIVPLVLEVVPVKSVVDVGCGEGDWLAAFEKFGVGDIWGVDGPHVEAGRLKIPEGKFQVADLKKAFRIDRTFDLAVSLEVAEHLPASSAAIFVESLVHLAPAILFSAAIPFQGGIHHVNEQWADTWAGLFREQKYLAVDFVRKRVWKNEKVDWWYAQNTMLFAHPRLLETNAALRREFEQTNADQLSLVHPRKYLEVAGRPPAPEPSWGVKGASRLLMASVRDAVRRRILSMLGKETPESKNGNAANTKG
jgi:SAM-dependent methyltransferase